VPEFIQLVQVFQQAGYKGLYTAMMQMPQDEVNKLLQPLLKRIGPLFNLGKLEKSQADYWAAKAALAFSKTHEIDRGIFSIYLFNLLQLRRGEAIFQDAGVPHAYLEGRNVEIMASSDNVLRGGLTTKRVDVAALLKHVKCEATNPYIIKGEKRGSELVYITPAPDFELSSFLLEPGEHVSTSPNTAEIYLLVAGEVILTCDSFHLDLKNGQPAAIAWPGKDLQIDAKQPSWLFRATVPFTDVD
jgi:mannose-6-phosphate isomerase